MKILDAEFDINFLEAETAERYDAAINNYNKAHAEFSKQQHGYADTIKSACYIVFDFLNDLLGEGAADEIFGDSCDLRAAMRAMQAIHDEFKRQTSEMYQEFPEFAAAAGIAKQNIPQNREQRRAAEKQKKARHFTLGEGNLNESAD